MSREPYLHVKVWRTKLSLRTRNPRAARLAGLTNTFSAFRIPAYRFVWLSQVSSTSGMQMQMFARGLLAYELGGTAGAIGVVGLGQAIPQGMFSMFGGTIADRFERRRVMMVTQLLNAIVAVLVSVLVRADMMTIPLLFISGVIQGTSCPSVARRARPSSRRWSAKKS